MPKGSPWRGTLGSKPSAKALGGRYPMVKRPKERSFRAGLILSCMTASSFIGRCMIKKPRFQKETTYKSSQWWFLQGFQIFPKPLEQFPDDPGKASRSSSIGGGRLPRRRRGDLHRRCLPSQALQVVYCTSERAGLCLQNLNCYLPSQIWGSPSMLYTSHEFFACAASFPPRLPDLLR